MHHKISNKIPHRTVYVESLGTLGQKWSLPKSDQKLDCTQVKIIWVGSLKIKSTHISKSPDTYKNISYRIILFELQKFSQEIKDHFVHAIFEKN